MIEKTLTDELIYKGRIINVRKETVELPNGEIGTRELVDHDPAVVILPLDSDGTVHLIKQFRKPLNNIIIEAPAGIMDPGESPLVAAQRELQEETGFIANEWISLGQAFPSPGFCDELYHIFLAKGLTPGPQQFDSDEFLTLYPLSWDSFYSACTSNEITDAKTLLACFFASRHL